VEASPAVGAGSTWLLDEHFGAEDDRFLAELLPSRAENELANLRELRRLHALLHHAEKTGLFGPEPRTARALRGVSPRRDRLRTQAAADKAARLLSAFEALG
jgi:hypothetical protein